LELLKRYGIKISTSTINRIMHEYGLIKRALKKHQKKMNITKYYGAVESPEGLADRCKGFNLYSKHFCAYKIGYFAKVLVF